MLDQGRVIKTEGNLAWIEFTQSSACARCGACHMAASGKMINETENSIGAKVGDLVEVEISSAATILFPLLGFGVPILFLFIGIILGSFISEIMGIILGVGFLVIGFFAVRLIDRYISKEKKFRSKIVRVVSG